MMSEKTTSEHARLKEAREGTAPWRKWGPYLSERQWGTVREDYSEGGTAWDYFPHDHARSRAYRWGEDGLAGLCDEKQRLCFALALWNGADPILKERAFGLTNSEGNHGEDVKEHYFYLDATPTHSYGKYLYKYPQRAFPYDDLVRVNAARSRQQPEYELIDTGIFKGDRYFDVFAEHAKASAEDILILLTVHNRGPEPAPLHAPHCKAFPVRLRGRRRQDVVPATDALARLRVLEHRILSVNLVLRLEVVRVGGGPVAIRAALMSWFSTSIFPPSHSRGFMRGRPWRQSDGQKPRQTTNRARVSRIGSGIIQRLIDNDRGSG
jgi:hypothetical protein